LQFHSQIDNQPL